MVYTEMITSDDDPISHATTTPDFETVALTTPFYGESDMVKQLWSLNQYSYEQDSSQPDKIYAETSPWNTMLKDYKISLAADEMLWGWDATESHSSFTT